MLCRTFFYDSRRAFVYICDGYDEWKHKQRAKCFLCGRCFGLPVPDFLATYFQYNATYLATYVESGVRRISLAEQLRKIPLSFFGKKDLADLTNSIMGDCATLETAFSHYVPALAGSLISTALISVCLFAYDWRMALAAVWVLPVGLLPITCFSARIQEYFNRQSVAGKCSPGKRCARVY